jgi:hypothetical protein
MRPPIVAGCALLLNCLIGLAESPVSFVTTDNGHLARIAVDQPRALLHVCVASAERYGWDINYEDHAVSYAGDVVETESSIRRRTPGKWSKPVMGFRPEKFAVVFEALSNSPFQASTVVAEVLRQAKGSTIGEFSVRQQDKSIDVVPTGVRNQAGEWREFVPVLDTRVTIPGGEKTLAELLLTLIAKLNEASGHRVELGVTPAGLDRFQTEKAFSDVTAREVLRHLIDRTGIRLTWQLRYGNEAFHLSLVPTRMVRSDLLTGEDKVVPLPPAN